MYLYPPISQLWSLPPGCITVTCFIWSYPWKPLTDCNSCWMQQHDWSRTFFLQDSCKLNCLPIILGVCSRSPVGVRFLQYPLHSDLNFKTSEGWNFWLPSIFSDKSDVLFIKNEKNRRYNWLYSSVNHKTLHWSYDVWEAFSGVGERISPSLESCEFPKKTLSIFLAI